MPRVAAAAPKKRAAPKNVKLAEEFTKGTVITDILKKQWKLGEVIGQGGFGLVYHANAADSSTSVTSSNAQFVIKIEPGANGPLFCEMNFYIRAAKKEFIDGFVRSHKLKYLAVPPYIGSGLHSYNSTSYRFLVMPRYGTDLQKLLQNAGGTFSSATVFAIGIRMTDALQYLHEREYVHADVKASNILLGYNGHSENRDQVYLADYGLAYRYIANDEHKQYKVDPRNAHNGTIEFTSRDAHKGVFPSRRGDMEILGFCLMQWLCRKLPWESNLTNPVFVAQKKEDCMKDVRSFVKSCLPGTTNSVSDCMINYLQEVNKLDYQDEPNYRKFKDILKTGLSKEGQKDEWKLGLSDTTQGKKRKSQGTESPMVSPKKPKVAAAATKGGKKAAPSTPKAKSPKKKIDTLQKKSPLVNGKRPTASSPAAKTVPVKKRGSPAAAKAAAPRKRFDATKSPKTYQIPPPTKRSPRKSPATPRPTTTSRYIRRVRKGPVSQSDASIQTTPGLKNNGADL